MSELKDWLAAHPDVGSLRLAICDLNGRARGKRIARAQADKAGSARMPYSALNLDLRGDDIANSPLVFDSGDRDGTLRTTGRGPVPMPWLNTPSAMIQMALHHEDGRPFAGDPRHALNAVVDRYAARGWQAAAAFELEFFLVDASGGALRPAAAPGWAAPYGGATLSLTTLDGFEAFFNDLYDGAEAMDIALGDTLSESGSSQFEAVLTHQDPLDAADDAWHFRLLVEGTARRHGMVATFQPKPFADQAGNGLHLHTSIIDAQGANIFDDGGSRGTPALRHAIAGCLSALPATTLICAPFGSSFERFVNEAHAPTRRTWGYENRTVALRVPGGSPAARRIEHRVAGGDANPYLLLAAVLGAALDGIEAGAEPPAPTTGNGYDSDAPRIPTDWAAAIDLFESDPALAGVLPADLMTNLALTKRQELAFWPDLSDSARLALTLGTV